MAQAGDQQPEKLEKPKCTCGARPWEYEPCYCGKGMQPEEYYRLFMIATGITTIYDE